MSWHVISALRKISKDKPETPLVSIGIERGLDNTNTQNIVLSPALCD